MSWTEHTNWQDEPVWWDDDDREWHGNSVVSCDNEGDAARIAAQHGGVAVWRIHHCQCGACDMEEINGAAIPDPIVRE